VITVLHGDDPPPHLDHDEVRQVRDVDGLAEALPGTEVLLVWDFLSDAVRDAWPGADTGALRWVHTASAGVDRLLFPGLLDSDVLLTNSRGVFDAPMAEYVLGLVLAMAKDLPGTLAAQGRHDWHHRETQAVDGTRAVVVGGGPIGHAIARMLGAVGIGVELVGRRAAGGVHAFDELPGLLPAADWLVLAAPLTDATRGMLDAAALAALPARARVINVGRGGLVVEPDLVDAVAMGRIAGAALDVVAAEPLAGDSPLWDLPGVIVSPHMSAVEATAAVLERIAALDPQVNAFCLVDADGALDAARASEKRWQRGEPRGRIDGVPVSVKDLFLTAGHPTLRGSHSIDPAGPWPVDAPAVARVRAHGGVIVGKTTTPELGWKGVTDSPLTGATGNPWDPSRTSGGSSGGSAAAVALGMAPLSLGTDGGGSVRIPAAFTATTTIKPTYGRAPLYPASPFGTLAHAGPMARTATDAALLLDVLAGPDARDPWALAPTAPTADQLGRPLSDLRIAVSPALGHATVEPGVAAAFAAAVDVFAALGARVEAAEPGFANPLDAFETLWFAGAAKSIEPLGAEARARLDPGLLAVAERGARTSALDYLGAMAIRNELGGLMGAFHARYDLLLTPTLPITAFGMGMEVPAGWPRERWTTWTPFTYPFNMTQQPAASVPCGFVGGLPVGLQIVGPRHADAGVLAAAHAFQQATDWHRRRPPLLT
jgi:aspartyl-tRNA(Asn)/glutamyl-tRNA(Gln) amidotransferase subunit A